MHEECEKKEKGIRVSSLGRDNISLENLNEEEVENMKAMVENHFWVTVTDGRLEVVRRRKELPLPYEDESMLPFWRRAKPVPQQLQLFDVEVNVHASPSIIIQSLCGYNYSPESYKRQAEKLESYGFSCLRSRRGDDARFWEVWYLPGLWSAQGPLKEAIKLNIKNGKELDNAILFLCHTVQFGTLDISFQWAAATIPE